MNGSEAQTHYNIFIRLNSDNSVVYDSGKIASSVGLHTVPNGTLSNGIIYKFQVWSYNTISTYTESNWEIFMAITSSSVTFAATPTSEQNFTFSALYTSSNAIPVKVYQYKLYLTSNLTTAISDSGEIYPDILVVDPTTPLEYEFEGLVSSTSYSVECVVRDQNDFEITTGKIAFIVTYLAPTTTDYLLLTPLDTIGAISLSWANLKSIVGIADGTYNYENPFTYTTVPAGKQDTQYISEEITVTPEGFARISTFNITTSIPPGTHMTYFIRYSEDGITWSSWISITNNTNITSIIGKYTKKIQYKLILVGDY